MKDENINISKDEKLAILLMESFDNPSDEAIALLDNEGCAQACKDLMDIEMALNKEQHTVDPLSMLHEFHARKRKSFAHRILFAISAAAAVAAVIFILWDNTSQQTMSLPIAKSEYIYKADNTVYEQLAETKSHTGHKAMIRVFVPYGSTKTLRLPDGTEVMLNAGSRLSYPKHFDGERREVSLYGEAFFKVKKNAHRPFIVKSGSVNTTVLGTQFNVRHYGKEAPKVVLVEGRVMLSDSIGTNNVTMLPGQSATLSQQGGFVLTEDKDIERTISWTNGYQYYDDISLENMLNEIGRWYNVDVVCKNQSARKNRVHFYISNNQSLEKTVEMINKLNVAHITLENKQIIVR